jgi:hypothetical protein
MRNGLICGKRGPGRIGKQARKWMSALMRCLLDKVVARRSLEGLLRLAEGRDLTGEELWAVDLLWYGAGGEDGGY